MNEDDMYDAFERGDLRHEELLKRILVIEAVFDKLFPGEDYRPSLSTVEDARWAWLGSRPK